MLESLFATVMVTEIVVMSVAMYVLPVIIGCIRRVPDIGSVIVINILLGWTLAGWVVALALALRSATSVHPVVQVVQNVPPGRPAAPGPPSRLPPAGWAGQPGAPAPREDPPPLVLPRRPAGYRDAGPADPADRG
jgi:hypothetical protein